MTWADPQWVAFCALLEEAWPGEFDDHSRTAWRVLLDPLDPAAAVEGLRRLLLEGHRFRPSVSEVLAAARRDPSRPTFSEAFELIYGRGGVMAARPSVLVWEDDRERRLAYRQAALDRAAQLHPLVHAFIARQDLDRLRQLPVHDPQWGEKRRADLERAWNEHVETWDGREVAVLASGERRGLQQFDPLAALGRAGLTPRPELEETTSS
jgi:hypothetical protein